ncbi:hypothetical protein XU18_2095 [Perkinsela sp. CCAP 1560/4]|nr:hypothetical protein XU18_2095 [Perkinsela sp. CCAP 1560/4]|eukprot:KNH07232.1 hypothetical protein XU18_2095 [Perkinsela sp. CCAP 1560/4]
MFAALFVACDDGTGRVDRSTLSQQALMELFIFGLNEPEKICGTRDGPDDVCKWRGVKCNADGEVERFLWSNKKKYGNGTLGFEFLPRSIQAVHMSGNSLSGTIQLADLPGRMEVVSLTNNKLTGSLDLDTLPATFRGLQLCVNQFTGEISLENLPKCLEFLSLAVNQLSGTICLTSLPPVLETLDLGQNRFEGSLDFRRIPESVRTMQLNENRFSGTIDLGNLPESMVLDVRQNTLSGTVRVPQHGLIVVLEGNDELTVERIE